MMQSNFLDPVAIADAIEFPEPQCPCGFAHSTLNRLILREQRNLIECEAAMHPMASRMAPGVARRVENLRLHLEGRCA